MSPNKLKATLLENASTEQQQAFAKMLAEQCATAELQAKGHRCRFFIPSQQEYDQMKKYTQPPNYDQCPKCGKGRVVVEIFQDSMGDSWSFVCTDKRDGCDFKERIEQDEI